MKACQVLSVSSSGYFKSLKAPSQSQYNRNQEDILKAFELHKRRYGYRKISHDLNRNSDFLYSPAQVRHILKKRDLKPRKAKPFKPVTIQSVKSCPAAQRVFKSGETVLTAVNQVWGSDITYLKVIEGNFLYLAVFLDFYSRKIVGWDLESQFILCKSF